MLRRPLLRWYRRHRRRLPWRDTREPYAILVAETMLQQTRTETVLRYYPKFLARFPNFASLARAPEGAVLAAWSGLGYYSRARNLRRTARVVVMHHDGELPRDLDGLQSLPGVGRYSAGAIASIAFGIRAPVLDGNVARVLARLFAIEGPLRSAAVVRTLWAVAESLVPARSAGDWNQALMDLGATVCRPRDPDCPRCPLRRHCVAFRHDRIERLPTPPRRRPTIAERRSVFVLARRGRLLLVRRDRGRLLRGLWQFPTRADLRRLGIEPLERVRAARIHHTIMNRRIETCVFRARANGGVRLAAGSGARWVPCEALADWPLSAVGLKIASSLLRP